MSRDWFVSRGAKRFAENGPDVIRNEHLSSEGAGNALPINRIEVARAADTMLVRVHGLGSVATAGVLWDFARKALDEGLTRFAFDLAACRGLDSTFLGTLVGLAQEAVERAGEDGWVCVFNVSDGNREIFQIVGADKYVRFRSHFEMEPIETQSLPGGTMQPEKRQELVHRAHKNLVGIDRRNEARFGEFLRRLAAEMAGGG